MTSTSPKISLVLATIGRTSELAKCLQSLAAQTDTGFEVLVVDQNSDDRLVPLIANAKGLGANVQHLRLNIPSLSGARNLGISKCSGEIIGFPDDDCWYEPEVVATLRRRFAEDEHLGGMVACWVEQTAARRDPPNSGLLSLHAWRTFRGGDASSISLFFRRSVFDELHGFDERLGLGKWFGAGEETELLLRVLESGHNVAYCSEARVRHHFGGSGTGAMRAKYRAARSRARGTGAIYAKHRLGNWVVLRGLLGPLVKPILTLQSLERIVLGQATFIGRLEGMLRWRWRQM
jgi:GT2 family glycosyltransferase